MLRKRGQISENELRFWLFIVCVFLIAVDSISAFSEFNSYFPEAHPASKYSLLLNPKSCEIFNFPLQPFELSLLSKSAENVRLHFQQSLENLQRAKIIAKYSFSTEELPLLSVLSLACYNFGIESVNHASAALKAAFDETDLQFSQLDLLQGDEEIFSQSLADEKNRLENAVIGKSDEEEFSIKLHAASANLSQLWKGFPFSNLEKFDVVSQMLGKDGVLHSALLFRQKTGTAIKQLENLHLEESRSYNRLIFESESGIEKLEKEKAPEIHAAKAITLIQIGTLSTSPSKFSFNDELYELKSILQRARFLHSDSEKSLSSKQRGYLAFAILRKQEANKLLSELSFRASETLKNAGTLEKLLREQADTLELEAEDSIATKLTEPIVYNYLRSKFDKYAELKGKILVANAIGERANLLVEAVTLLNQLTEASRASDSIAFEISAAKGKIDKAKSLIIKAKKDKVDVFEEERRLVQIEASLASIKLESDASLVFSIADELDTLEGEILGKASEDYSDLPRLYANLYENKQFLKPEDRLRLESYSRYFDGTELSAEDALGELYSIQAFLLKKSEEFEIQKPQILRKHLEATLVINEIVETVPPDTPTKVTAYVSIENLMPFQLPEISLSLPLPSNARLVNSSHPSRLENVDGQLHLKILDLHDGRFNAILEYEIIANTLLSENTEIISATSEEAKVRKTIRFKTLKRSALALKIEAPSENYDVRYNGRYNAGKEGNYIALTLESQTGQNQVEITFKIPEPFELNSRTEKVDGVSMLVELEYANKHMDLPSADLDFQTPTNCDIKQIQILQTDFKITDKSVSNYLVLELKANDWLKGTAKKAVLKLICNNQLSSLIQEKLQSASDLALSFDDSLRLAEANQKFSSGDLSGVLADLGSIASRQSQSIEARTALFKDIASMLRENNYAPELLSYLESGLQAAGNHLLFGRTEDAEKALSGMENKLKNFFSEKIIEMKSRCGRSCPPEALSHLGDLNLAMALNDYKAAMNSLILLETMLDENERLSQTAISDKLNALGDYDQFENRFSDAMRTYETYFKVEEEYASEAKYSTYYKTALSAKNDLEKRNAELAAIKNAVETNASSKYSADLIAMKMGEALSALENLENSNSKIQLSAIQQRDEAIKRQKQFGSPETAALLQKAADALDSENYLTAYLIASGLNSQLQPQSIKNQFDPTPFALPVIIGLLAASYYLLFRRKGESSQSDLPDVLEER